MDYKLNLWNNIFEAFLSPATFGVLSSAYAAWLKSPNTLIGRFQPNDESTQFSILQIITMNS